MKYLLVFNSKAKHYSREGEETIIRQAAGILGGTVTVTHTTPQAGGPGQRYDVADFARYSQHADCVIAVGGDGTINLVVSALARHALLTHVSLGVIPYGTGNNLVRSYGLQRTSDKALATIRQGHTIQLDIGVVNQEYYGVNASFGLFPYLLAHRVTNSRLGYTYEALRHIGFRPWPLRIRYTDAADQTVDLVLQHYIVGALLNTSHYGSILRMAPDVVSDDGLFDVKLIRATPRLMYPLVGTIILTGKYALSRHTLTFRAKQVELWPETACAVEMDGELIPTQPRYRLEIAGQARLLVPPPHA